MKSAPFYRCIYGLLLFGLLPSCSKKNLDGNEVAALPQLTSQNPLSDERRLRLEAFGKELAASVREGDAEAFEKREEVNRAFSSRPQLGAESGETAAVRINPKRILGSTSPLPPPDLRRS